MCKDGKSTRVPVMDNSACNVVERLPSEAGVRFYFLFKRKGKKKKKGKTRKTLIELMGSICSDGGR